MTLVAASEIVCSFVFVLKNKHDFVLAASAISRLSSIDFFYLVCVRFRLCRVREKYVFGLSLLLLLVLLDGFPWVLGLLFTVETLVVPFFFRRHSITVPMR